MTLRALRRFGFGILAACSLRSSGCGHTDEEMAAKQREIDKLSADLKAAQAQIATDQTQYSDAQSQIDKLKSDLQAAGLTAQQSQDNAAQASAGARRVQAARRAARRDRAALS